MFPRSCSASRPPISVRGPRRSSFWPWWRQAPASSRPAAPAPSTRFRHYDTNRRDAMKYLVVIALLVAMPLLADWRWEGRAQARQAVPEARRARAETMREVAHARQEVRREMYSAHRQWHTEFRQAQAEFAHDMRQFREEMRQASRSWRAWR